MREKDGEPILAPRRRDEAGATATEYALLLMLIAFALVAGATTFGVAMNDYYDDMGGILGGLFP